jgi:hypothetical protein
LSPQTIGSSPRRATQRIRLPALSSTSVCLP